MLTPIAGRVAIVTGASKGIGKGIARVFARHGVRVFVVSRNITEATACASELAGEAVGYAADISTWDGAQAMAAAAAEHFGGIDILCANAGIFPSNQDRKYGPRGMGQRHDHERQRLFHGRQSVPAMVEKVRPGSRRIDLINYRDR